MSLNLINLALAFLEGFALIVSPCILPILPIILAGSLTGNKKRPYGIIIGFILTFTLFTLFSRELLEHSGIDLNLIRHLSYGLIILFGLIMMSTTLTEKFMHATRGFSNLGRTLSFVQNSRADFSSGILFGGLVSLIWTPCAGPILATVIAQTVIQQTTWISFLTLLSFTIGAAGPMLLIAIFGKSLIQRLGFLNSHTLFIRKLLGAIIILTVAYMMYFGLRSPFTFATTTPNKPSIELINGLATPYPAPPLRGIIAWINSPPLELSALQGKVVLIDFWTYSCINCIRTLPYLKDWYNQYHDKGLVIIGVHTPEFDFEKSIPNVMTAVAEDGIRYPVALDNQFETWQAFKNDYWPAHYLIDQKGDVVYTHFGEGDNEVTENNIRFLLGIHETTQAKPSPAAEASFLETPETYLGDERADRFMSPEPVATDEASHYSFPPMLPIHAWALQGNWTIMSDRIISAEKNAAIMIHFAARHVYIVMGSANAHPIHVQLLLNGKPIKTIDVEMNKLYDAISLDHFGQGNLEVLPGTPGLEIYSFTFGG